MNEYQFTQRIHVVNFDLMIDPVANYGYFEHHRYGDNLAGGLWFEGRELIDYDGVACLPRPIIDALELAGYDTSSQVVEI